VRRVAGLGNEEGAKVAENDFFAERAQAVVAEIDGEGTEGVSAMAVAAVSASSSSRCRSPDRAIGCGGITPST